SVPRKSAAERFAPERSKVDKSALVSITPTRFGVRKLQVAEVAATGKIDVTDPYRLDLVVIGGVVMLTLGFNVIACQQFRVAKHVREFPDLILPAITELYEFFPNGGYPFGGK
ncbi:MAG TPA: hypothetical protein VLB87_11065, partial [Pyrinomonadaceae bacterium]|nr:hypothetical protein [Pyrinomonadaceae bacterium]